VVHFAATVVRFTDTLSARRHMKFVTFLSASPDQPCSSAELHNLGCYQG